MPHWELSQISHRLIYVCSAKLSSLSLIVRYRAVSSAKRHTPAEIPSGSRVPTAF